MEHPFFNAIAFPWHRPEAQTLHEILAQRINKKAEIELLYRKSQNSLPSLNLDVTPKLLWAEVLENLTKSKGLEAFCNLLKNEDPQTAGIIQLIENATPASEVKIFNDHIFILDCENHRQAISDCTSDLIAKVLLIRGGAKSGKSHCRYILEEIARQKNVTVVYLSSDMIATLEEAIVSICSALGTSTDRIPPQLSTDDAWYRTVCMKLQEIATAQKKKIWIVVDDLGYNEKDGGPLLDPKIRMFFEQFALYFMNPAFKEYFRLMLINYAEQNVPSKWKAEMWAEERTDEKHIQKSHIEDFIKYWTQHKKINILEQNLNTLATDVMDRTQNPPQQLEGLSRLERINRILTSKLAEIQNQIP